MYKILNKIFINDIVNIIIEYNMISKEKVKKNYDNVLLELFLFFIYDNMIYKRRINGFHFKFKKR